MSFPRYAEYKDSGVEWLGEVPQGWCVYSLKRAIDGCTNGFWGGEPNGHNDLCVLRVADFNRNNFTVGLDKLTYRLILPKEAESRLLKYGDLLLEKSGGGEKTLVGCVVQFNQKFAAITSNFVAKMTPKDSFVSRFLTYAFAHLYAGRVNFPSIRQTTGIQNLDSESYLMESFCFPPKNEQTQIAAFLDHETAKLDNLINQQKKLIDLLKEKRQAVISHAVTKGLNPNAPMKDSGVEWLGKVPEGWVVTKVKYIKSLTPNAFVDGPFGSNLKSEHFIDGGDVYVIESNFATQNKIDINELKTISFKHFELISRSEVSAGDVVIAKIGAQFGKSSILPNLDKRAVVSGNSLKLTVNNQICLTVWAHFQLLLLKMNSEIDLLVNGSAQPALSLGGMNNLNFLLPPLSEQSEIIGFLDQETAKIDNLIQQAQKAITLLQERRTALISAAVTGKIDVRGFVKN